MHFLLCAWSPRSYFQASLSNTLLVTMCCSSALSWAEQSLLTSTAVKEHTDRSLNVFTLIRNTILLRSIWCIRKKIACLVWGRIVLTHLILGGSERGSCSAFFPLWQTTQQIKRISLPLWKMQFSFARGYLKNIRLQYNLLMWCLDVHLH